MTTPDKPLTNTERMIILRRWLNSSNDFLSDLEKDHFRTSARSEMRPIFATRVQALNGAFDSVYDDYLLSLWYELENPPPVGGGDTQSGVPIGFMNLGITYP